MTPQEQKVMEQALEELENCADLLKMFEAPIDSCVGGAMLGAEKAANAIKEALAQPEQLEGLQLIHKADIDLAKKRAIEAQPERHELQAEGKHPAPCARFCEANAFQIEIRRLKAQLAQPKEPEQEPVAIPRFGLNPDNGMMYESNRGPWCLYKDTTPPQPQNEVRGNLLRDSSATPRKPLTDEQIERAITDKFGGVLISNMDICRAIEAAHGIISKEKNTHE